MGRLVFLCGGSAAGKTTVAEDLKSNHNFVHFDGDLWCVGVDPVTESGRRPSQDDMKQCPEAINQLHDNFFKAYFDKAIAGDTTADLTACQSLYGAMAQDLHKLRSEGLAERDFVISHVVCHRAVRDVLRQAFGSELQCLVLLTPREVLVERRMVRMRSVAAAQGKSIEALAMSYPGTGTAQERIEVALKRCIAAEPVGKDEQSCYQLDITGEMDQMAVAASARAQLGLE